MKDAGRIVHGKTAGHHLVDSVQYGDFRFGRRAIFAHLRINVAHVDVRAIGRGGHETGAPAGHEALGIAAAREVHQRNIVGQPVGHVEHIARRIQRDAGGFKPRRQLAQHPQRRGVHFAYRVRPGVGHVESLAVRRYGDSPRDPAHGHAARHGARRGVHHQHFVAAAAHHEKLLAIGRQRQVVGAAIARRPRFPCAGRQHQQQSANRPPHAHFSVMVTVWSAATPSTTWRIPLGQVTVMRSTLVCAPRPKCSRQSFWLR